ncbi:hypothetical protein JW905_17390, partial [bacterium]|nr:hypothetical protein [candidate division CSSED10-310 bacterium]
GYWNDLSWYRLQDASTAHDSLAAASRAVELEPAIPAYRHTKALALLYEGRYKDAVDELEIAVNQAPGNPAYRSDLDRARRLGDSSAR